MKEWLDQNLKFKEEAKKINNKFVRHTSHLIAQTRSGFGLYVVLRHLSQRRTVKNLIENGFGIVSLEKFNGYVDQDKQTLRHVNLDVEECISTIL